MENKRMRGFVRGPLAFALFGLAAVLSFRALAQSDSARDVAPADPLEASTAGVPQPGATNLPDEEITVRGKPLREYREEVEEARLEIIEVYNEVNSDDGNDITCREEAPTGTRVRQRVCRSKAEMRAEARAAGNFLNALFGSAGQFFSPPGTTVAGGSPVNAFIGTGEAGGEGATGTAAARGDLDEELRELQRVNRKLYRAVKKYLEVEEEYNMALEEARR